MFHDPSELKKLMETQGNGPPPPAPSYEEAMEEIARCSGVGHMGEGDSSVAQEVAEFLPHLDQANGISEELDKKVRDRSKFMGPGPSTGEGGEEKGAENVF